MIIYKCDCGDYGTKTIKVVAVIDGLLKFHKCEECGKNIIKDLIDNNISNEEEI